MSSYNRLGSSEGRRHTDDDSEYFSNNRYQQNNRMPSPQRNNGVGSPGAYQMDQRPPRPLDMPMGPMASNDRLSAQPTYNIQGFDHSYGQHGSAAASTYDLDYYNQPHGNQQQVEYYENQNNNYHHNQNNQYEPSAHAWQDESDQRPMLSSNSGYGPNPSSPFEEIPPSIPTPQPQPVSQLKRWKTVREVQLFDGNLVLDCPIPPRLLNQVPHVQPPERDEFTHMRYTAATCDPSNFLQDRFTLRQRLFAKPRQTELFIVITMYNEEDELFARTMIGVIKNIEFMNGRNNSKTWGKDAWKKIVVCVVSDGREKINPRTRALLAAMGCYQEGIAKSLVNDKPVTAHIYEYTSQMAIDLRKGVVSVRKGNTPVQMLFCLKEKNQKKINSHRWFFKAFGDCLQPNVCVLIDAGTRPGKDSIYKLWKAFDRNPNCGGACGEIKAMLEKGKNLINPLIATQNFEYKMSNILDKPLESAFGFISVLPGAFSAYKFVALQNDKTGQGPLDKYFAGEKMHNEAGVFTANMYLAEDRILCFELVSKRNSSWVLSYVKGSTGETDVPEEMSDFILQRRRWLNGSFFAAVYALVHFYQIWRSSHNIFRILALHVEFLYQTISMIFAWFALGNFFLVFSILTRSLSDTSLLGKTGGILAVVFEWAYLATLMTCFVLALGNRPEGNNRLYLAMVYFWVVIMAYLMFASVFVTVRSIQSQVLKGFSIQDLFANSVFSTLIVSMASTYVLWFVVSFLFFDPWHMFTCFIQYLLMTPTYINILNVYAFCNTHDISWGTKGDTTMEKLGVAKLGKDGKIKVDVPMEEADLNTQYEKELNEFAKPYVVPKKIRNAEDKKTDYYTSFRSVVVLLWMFSNAALAEVVLNAGGVQVIINPQQDSQVNKDRNAKIYLAVVLWSVAGLSLFRFLGAMWFLIGRIFRGI